MARSNSNYSLSLVKLGLTADEVECYTNLLNSGSLSASDLAKKVTIFPNAVYRLAASLKKKGFVVELDTHPTKFQAIPPTVAIEAYSRQKIKDLEGLKDFAINDLSKNPAILNQTKIDILTGKNAMFTQAAKLIEMAKTEVLIVSIGEPVPDDIKIANRDAIQKGVTIKFLAHKYDQTNHQLLKSWVKMGLDVRHLADSGYHLSVTDGKVALLATNNPQNTEERTALVIYSEGLAKALRNYFFSLWEKAVPI